MPESFPLFFSRRTRHDVLARPPHIRENYRCRRVCHDRAWRPARSRRQRPGASGGHRHRKPRLPGDGVLPQAPRRGNPSPVRRVAIDRRGRQRQVPRRQGRPLERLPQDHRPQRYRRRPCRHTRPLACPADDHCLPLRQGRLLRKTPLQDHPRGAKNGRSRPQHRAGRPDGHAPALGTRLHRGRQTDRLRQTGQDHGHQGLRHHQHVSQGYRQGAAQRSSQGSRLGNVARPPAVPPLPGNDHSLQVPLVGPLRFAVLRQRRAFPRHHALAHRRPTGPGAHLGTGRVFCHRRRPHDPRCHGRPVPVPVRTARLVRPV